MLILQIVLRYSTAINNPEINSYELYFEDMRSIFHLSLDGLIMGMAAALICHDKASHAFISKKMVSNICFSSGTAIFICLSLMGPLVDLHVSFFDKVLQPSIISLGFGLMLIGLLGECSASRLFSWGGFFPIALISYSLYLLHLPLMYGAEVVCRLILISLGLDMDQFSEYTKVMLYWPVWLSITAGLSGISYLVFEKPFLFGKTKKNNLHLSV
jgi:peptidoglycan/LPS O-acetylase OafA/YrhL